MSAGLLLFLALNLLSCKIYAQNDKDTAFVKVDSLCQRNAKQYLDTTNYVLRYYSFCRLNDSVAKNKKTKDINPFFYKYKKTDFYKKKFEKMEFINIIRSIVSK